MYAFLDVDVDDVVCGGVRPRSTAGRAMVHNIAILSTVPEWVH